MEHSDSVNGKDDNDSDWCIGVSSTTSCNVRSNKRRTTSKLVTRMIPPPQTHFLAKACEHSTDMRTIDTLIVTASVPLYRKVRLH